MKEKVVILKNEEEVSRQQTDSMKGVSVQMRSDAFTALTLSMIREPFMSSDTKYIVIYGMLDNLEKMGYTEEEMAKFKLALNAAISKFHHKNSFMG